ncbi:high-affinity nitrate transporter-activating protein 2.1-like [Typha angustifolia]|uniref:high-affinity nitrate transporter-activating protein 2.1-like n=1 Tax=Typha angustifolia TaxID=59011 RepID=UPI003C2F8324
MVGLAPCKATITTTTTTTSVLLLVYYAWPSMGVLLSTLPKTLIVTASPKPGQVLYAGEDKITVTWALNQTLPAGTGSGYKEVKVSLCYAPVSQIDRSWRKSDDDLNKDKTCQFKIVHQPNTDVENTMTVEYMIDRIVPTATYFVRAYVLDNSGVQVAYGQTTDAMKTSNVFDIVGITGRHAAFDIAAGCFSAISLMAWVFFILKTRKAKK